MADFEAYETAVVDDMKQLPRSNQQPSHKPDPSAPDRSAWFYRLSPRRSLGKIDALNDEGLADFEELQKVFAWAGRGACRP